MSYSIQAFRFVFAVSIGLLGAACAPEIEDNANPDDPKFLDVEADEAALTVDEVPDEGPAPIAVLEPVDGYKMSFIELVGSDGVRGVGVAEEMPGGTFSIIDSVGLGTASPLNVFLAFSTENTPVPVALKEIYGSPSAKATRDRGYAIDHAVQKMTHKSTSGDVACNDGWFTGWVNDSLPSDTYRLNHDGTQGNWKSYCDASIAAFNGCSGCFNASRKKYEHTLYNVDEWRAYSCLRSGGTHRWACASGSDELPLRVYYRYRDANNNGWYTAYASPDQNYVGQNRTYSWHWYTGSNWDWQHTVRGAYVEGYDKVDLYTGWRP